MENSTRTVFVVKGRREINDEMSCELDSHKIREILGGLIPENAHNVSICVRVPGGGDWSNKVLEITEETPLIVKWEIFCYDFIDATIAK